MYAALKDFRRVVMPAIAIGFVTVLFALNDSRACTTPVYRYAMYRWTPAPYTVFYFYDSEPGEADREVQKAIEKYSDYDAENPANIHFVPVDLKKDPELKRMLPFVRKVWEEDNDAKLPAYMILSPLGDRLHRGKLDLDELKSFVESPARADVMKQIESGKTCVYVMLTCSKEEKNSKAETAAKKAIKTIGSGEIEFYDGELPYFGGQEEEGEDSEDGEEKPEEKQPTHSVGWLKVDRNSKTEQWLVRSLLSVEYDLDDIDEPMIFAVFGRGRALPPYLGKGITEDNLLDYFAEVTGACSCTVKDQNPGMDLLMRKDWDGVAEKMAERYSHDAALRGSIIDYFPQVVQPGESDDEEEEGEGESEGEGEGESTEASDGETSEGAVGEE